MTVAPTPDNEIDRLAALRRCGILDPAPDVAFDSLVDFIASLYETPIEHTALVAELTLARHAKQAVEKEHRAIADYLNQVEDERLRVAAELHAEAARRARFAGELDYSRTHDALTTLPNRRHFMTSLDAALASLRDCAAPGRPFAVYVADIDHCQRINDSLGSRVGDDFLIQCAERLRDIARCDDVVARLDSDTFAIIARGASTVDAATSVAREIRAAFAVPWRLSQVDCVVTASVGIVVVGDRYTSAEAILCDADIAMSRSKRQGGNRHSFFQDSLAA